MRVVIDTSVVVAAAHSGRGASRLIFDWVESGQISAVISNKLILEYEGLLRRQMDAIGWTPDEVTAFVDAICICCHHVDPRFSFRPSVSDPDDEFILELAFAAGADCLLTHNPRDFIGSERFGIKVISPRDFVRRQKGLP
jgi:putative PIN family toxin of toxin-antitoxin system